MRSFSMSVRVDPRLLHADATLVPPPAQRACEDRSFELPPVLHVATFVLFAGFVSVLSLAFANPELVVPWAIFIVFIAAFLTVPALWVRMAPANPSRALGWSRFMARGVETATGHVSGREATALVLLLPALIFLWSVAIAVIAAVA
jgi:hypothetical protein